MNFRVRACNRAAAGDYSDPVTLETRGIKACKIICTCVYIYIFGVRKILIEINTFINQGCIKLIKSESKDIYYVTKDFCFKYCCSLELYIHQRILKKNNNHSFHK